MSFTSNLLRRPFAIRALAPVSVSTIVIIIVITTVIATAIAACGGRAESTGGLPCSDCNVILISLDTLRADHLGAYGYQRPTSPHLDALADDGVLFENFVHNGGGTLPSHLTMLTSLRPTTHGVDPRNGRQLEAGHLTLAEHLRSAGYATAAFTDGGWMRARFGFGQGFDLFDEQGGRFANILPKVLNWLHDNRDRPFFLFVHSYDIHSETVRLPYDCPQGYAKTFLPPQGQGFDGCRDGRCASEFLSWANARIRNGEARAEDFLDHQEVETLEALYDGCIRYADDQVGQLFDRLRDLDLYDRSLIVVTSDHGEEFTEHGRFLHDQGGYEPLVHVPLILKLPYSSVRQRRVSRLAAMVDLLPTALDVVGVEPDAGVQGHSLLPTFLRDEAVRQAAVMFKVVRTPRWKLFLNTEELYDLSADPEEQRNLFHSSDALVQRFRAYQQRQAEADAEQRRNFAAETPARAPEISLSDQEVRELKALGYLD